MLVYRSPGFLKNKLAWFSLLKPKISKSLFYESHSCEEVGRSFFFKVFSQETIRIDLSAFTGDFHSYKANTRNEIRRAENIGVKSYVDSDTKSFVSFYNKFSELKGLNAIDDDRFMVFAGCYLFTWATYQQKKICAHAYVLDPELRVARLLYSASHFERGDSEERKFIGWANRYLHHMSLMHFKSKDFLYYDFGGISHSTKEFSAISKFKEGFGGERILLANYISYPNVLYISIKSMIKWARNL